MSYQPYGTLGHTLTEKKLLPLYSLPFKPPPHAGSQSTAPVLVGSCRVLREGHQATPHHGEGEGDPAVDQRVGGALALRYQTWGSGFAIPDWGLDHTTPQRRGRPSGRPKGGRGSGFEIPDLGLLALRYQTGDLATPGERGEPSKRDEVGGALALRY